MADRDSSDCSGDGPPITPDMVGRVYVEAASRIEADLGRRFNWPLAGWDVEDVRQAAVLQLLRAPDRYNPHRGTLQDYYHGMCLKIAHKRLRELDRRRKQLGTRAESDVLENIAANDDHSHAEPPSHALQRTILEEEIPKLPDYERIIIEADLKSGGVAPAEPLARQLACHPSTIRSRRQRVHDRLRKILRRRRSDGETDG